MKKLAELLEEREFVYIASCDFENRPNAVPKFFLKIEGNFIYLIDYVLGRTFNNLKNNPRVSLAIMDNNALKGYQVNGTAKIVGKGILYKKMIAELKAKEIDFTVERIIEGVRGGKRSKGFEAACSGEAVIFKVKIKEIVEVNCGGELRREKL
ncbi:MAG: pyridoxamine 5'-phosphate oxidase family protein [Candidatus Omnitrophica bacterium]|nr:pyridoxamine 5'-phosphate oxidase family protein [Candidatus Omnitrophota bacterium]